jgi:peroxiredoxin
MKPLKIIVCALAAIVLATPALAQEDAPERRRRGPRMQTLAPEKAKAAWEWQARWVAHELKLTEEAAEKVVEIYLVARQQLVEAARESQPAAGEGRRGEGQRGEGQGARRGQGPMGFGVNRELVTKARGELEAALSAVMEPEQTEQAMTSLGSFSRQWDVMVDAILGFELEPTATYAALAPLGAYMSELSALREAGDWQAVREGWRGAREKLMSELGEVLDEEQLEQFAQLGRRGRDRGQGQREGRGQPEGRAEIGQPAPDFVATDSAGKRHALADYKGKIVVLQWINPDCPVCRRTSESGKVAAMKKELSGLADNVVHLTVSTTHYMEVAKAAKYLGKNKIDAPVLDDRNGKIGRLYGAATTPHMFVIDEKGVLRYRGAIDDDQYGDKGLEATNYVVNAVRQMVAGETVTPDVTKSYGCTVKYGEL